MGETLNFVFHTTNRIRLDEFLRLELPEKLHKDCSNSKIRRLIVAGAVKVNNNSVVRPGFELRGKSTVSVQFDSEKFFFEKQPDDIQFTVTEKDILFEDDNLIFVNKPAFFPVEQTIVGNRANLHDAVVDFLWQRNPQLANPPYAGIMHRLDRETSGVILFTKNRPVNKAVSKMFQEHNFTKKYLTVVKSNPKLFEGKKFTVEKFMGRISGKSQAGKWGTVSESNGGMYSKTDFTVLKTINIENKQCFLVECNLYTGRTHQIRVHLSEAGFPILGDELYGGETAKRIYLHAYQLACKNDELNFDVKSDCGW